MRRDELLLYYERELRFIRKLASQFAEKYPQVASRLQIESTKCEDPHVERIIEAFAMLTGRIHLRLDDDFSEITDALMGILYPHYLRPVPSMTIVQMSADPDVSGVEGGFKIEAGSMLHSAPAGGVRCQFRTSYPLALYPLNVSEVEIMSTTSLSTAPIPADARSMLRIRLDTLAGLPFSELAIDSLTFFLDATSGEIHSLYELFLRDPKGLFVQPVVPQEAGSAPSTGQFIPPEKIRPVGFETTEGLLAYPSESCVCYRLLQD
jgi:type VI secretion system protein ImpG